METTLSQKATPAAEHTGASAPEPQKMQLNKLNNKDYLVTALRSYFLQNGFNYSNYQGVGYPLVMYPALKKLYGDDSARLSQELMANTEFYNTNPQLIPFITSLHLAMSEQDMPYDEIRGIKMALMGPLAGIGDSLSQFAIAPLYSTIFSSLSLQGIAIAPLGFLAAINITLIAIKVAMGNFGRKMGTTIIDKLSEQMGLVSECANIIGVTVIAALSAQFVKMQVNISFAAGAAAKGVKQSTVNIQSLLDAIAPALLPVLYTLLMYYLIKKRKWNTYQLVILTIVLGVVLSVAGILKK